jgi:hypothetical protein
MSRTLSPTCINTFPSHRIKQKLNENASPLKASEAMSGSPSPWKVFASMPIQAVERAKSQSVSEVVRLVLVAVIVVVVVVGAVVFVDVASPRGGFLRWHQGGSPPNL